ncbi:hypothetical protein VZT92_004805 [Zoarces viviparus]|uniref:Uncharacterized protein n=1 Tax=Zoarces viviparus TaxID=48416 RepID=A0AAW1FQC6_ZOAVI
MMEMHVEGGMMMTQHIAHKTPPRVPPKPASKSPSSFVSKVMGGRQQSPSPVRHVKGPTPTPIRPVSPASRLSVSPIRPVKSPIMTRKLLSSSAEVLPPWKQAGFVSEASYTSMTSRSSVSSSTQLHMEKHWEQQVSATRQAEGGVKAEAVALVVAAVDLARVCRPVQADEEEEEEEEAVEMKMKEEKSVVELKTLPAEPPPVVVAAVASDQLRVQVSQIQGSTESSSPAPHFTVSKVSVPKHEPSLEVRREEEQNLLIHLLIPPLTLTPPPCSVL